MNRRTLALSIALAGIAGCASDGLGVSPDLGSTPDLGPSCPPMIIAIQEDINPRSGTVVGSKEQTVIVFRIGSQFETKMNFQGLTGSLSGLHNFEGAHWEVRMYAPHITVASGTIQSNKLHQDQPSGFYMQPGNEVFELVIDTSSAGPGNTLWVNLSGPIHYWCGDTQQELNFDLKSSTFTYVSPLACTGAWNPATINCQNEGSPCDDGNPCTQQDSCQQGVCKGYWNTYCIPCRSDADCCGNNLPHFCPGPPGHAEIVPTGVCLVNRGWCDQTSNACPSNMCNAPQGCL